MKIQDGFDRLYNGLNNDSELISGDEYRVKSSQGGRYDAGYITITFDQRYKGNASQKKKLGNWREELDELGVTVDMRPSDEEWHNWGVIYDLSSVYIYRDDELVAESKWLNNMAEFLGDSSLQPDQTPLPVAEHSQRADIYQISVSSGNVTRTVPYKWEGAIGNTSSIDNGPEMHAAFRPVKKMAAYGTKMFYTSGFNEGKYPVQRFGIGDPTAVDQGGQYYVAGNKTYRMSFTDEVEDIAVQSGVLWIKFNHNVSSRDINGNTVWTDISRYDIATGQWLESTASSYPGSFPYMQAIPSGIRNNVGFDSQGKSFIVASNFTTFNSAQWWAVYDTNREQVRIYLNVGGTWTEQTHLTIGLQGGYANGPSVLGYPSSAETLSTTSLFKDALKLGAYYFHDGKEASRAVVCWEQDNGKLWVSDTATGRMLRFKMARASTTSPYKMLFDGSATTPNVIQWVPASYAASADPNSAATATRVFNEYLEFEVNVTEAVPGTKELRETWTLKNYWGHFYDGTTERVKRHGLQSGLFSVTTLNTAGQGQTPVYKTYALAYDRNPPVFPEPPANPLRVVELGASGLRETAVQALPSYSKLQSSGDILFYELDMEEKTVAFKRRKRGAFNTAGDPTYTIEALTTSPMQYSASDPISEESSLFALSADESKIVVYHPERGHSGFHLGAISRANPASPQWLWRQALTGPLNGKGAFDPYCENAGTDFCLVGNDIFFVYSGEFWRTAGQANQIMHYRLSDGQFLGQFGMPHAVPWRLHSPGSAGNIFTISPIAYGGNIFLHTNDEHSRGTHRWKVTASQ